jgi:hypothetical protein
LLLALIAAVILAAQTPTTGSYGPITVTNCSLHNNNGLVAANSLDIKYFNNTGDRTITAVQFHVRYRGVVEEFSDTGSFGPGAHVHHTFNNFYGLGWAGAYPSTCSVKSVTFSNGQVYKI